jgi:phosphoribosylanthranilate isomerase
VTQWNAAQSQATRSTGTQLKICGLLPGDDLSFASHPAVTHVGLVFVEGSRRHVAPDQARALIRHLPPETCPVGVFVNQPTDQIKRTVEEAGLAVAQLHGNEPPEDCRQLRSGGIRVWKAIPVPRENPNPRAIAEAMSRYVPDVDALLLDAAPPRGVGSVTGGHGASWDWSILGRVMDVLRDAALPPLWIAGGLHPGNVRDLLRCFRPAGIDVSSGVEVGGRKSPVKIREMLEAVREA